MHTNRCIHHFCKWYRFQMRNLEQFHAFDIRNIMFRNVQKSAIFSCFFFLWECAIDNQHALACQASHSLSTIKLECLLECLSRLPSTLQSIVVQFVSRSGWTVGSCYECVCLPAYFVTVAVVAKFHPLSCSEGFNFKPQQRTSDHVFLCLVIFI